MGIPLLLQLSLINLEEVYGPLNTRLEISFSNETPELSSKEKDNV